MPDDAVAAHELGVRAALDAGWRVLEKRGSALDAVQAAITVMEDDDTFDAGRGSFLTRDGRVQLDALLMSGADLRAGGVACVERLRNPIQAARLVLEQSPHVYFVGAGAERFATQHGMRLVDNTELIVPRERERLMSFQRNEAAGLPDTTFAGGSLDAAAASTGASKGHTGADPVRPSGNADPTTPALPSSRSEERLAPAQAPDPALRETAVEEAVQHGLPSQAQIVDPTLHSHDTVGAVALDVYGNLAAGTSTGGTLSKAPGRVGDSSLIGCGCYADDASAAVSLTGWGEPIMKLVLGKWATDRVAAGNSVQYAAQAAIDYLYARLGGHGGIILLDPDGNVGLAYNTPRMAWGLATAEGMELGTTTKGR